MKKAFITEVKTVKKNVKVQENRGHLRVSKRKNEKRTIVLIANVNDIFFNHDAVTSIETTIVSSTIFDCSNKLLFVSLS